jgi:hypothetical protein
MCKGLDKLGCVVRVGWVLSMRCRNPNENLFVPLLVVEFLACFTCHAVSLSCHLPLAASRCSTDCMTISLYMCAAFTNTVGTDRHS